jgi:hypothetical protein
MSLLTMGIITTVLIIMLVIGIILDEFKYDNLKGVLILISIIGIIIFGIFGFGMYATNHYDKMYVEKIEPDTTVKTEYKVYVEFEDTTLQYNDVENYKNIDSNTVWYNIKYYDMYGYNRVEKFTNDKIFENCELNKKIDIIKED